MHACARSCIRGIAYSLTPCTTLSTFRSWELNRGKASSRRTLRLLRCTIPPLPRLLFYVLYSKLPGKLSVYFTLSTSSWRLLARRILPRVPWNSFSANFERWPVPRCFADNFMVVWNWRMTTERNILISFKFRNILISFKFPRCQSQYLKEIEEKCIYGMVCFRWYYKWTMNRSQIMFSLRFRSYIWSSSSNI